jgi:hypothetical protein
MRCSCDHQVDPGGVRNRIADSCIFMSRRAQELRVKLRRAVDTITLPAAYRLKLTLTVSDCHESSFCRGGFYTAAYVDMCLRPVQGNVKTVTDVPRS